MLSSVSQIRFSVLDVTVCLDTCSQPLAYWADTRQLQVNIALRKVLGEHVERSLGGDVSEVAQNCSTAPAVWSAVWSANIF